MQAYQQVNEKFAMATLDVLRQLQHPSSATPVVWIHDYHLTTSAAIIRKVRNVN